MHDGLYRCEALQQFEWLTHAFGTRRVNPSVDVTLRQVHSNAVWNAHGLKDREQEGDGLVTGERGLTIGVRTADCVPILLVDSEHRVVAAVHAGWRGSAAEIVKRTIEKMVSDFASKPQDIWAAIGPCIRECSYEVGADVAEHFHRWTNPPVKANSKRNLNLVEVNGRQLVSAGVPAEQIFDLGLCTFCDADRFYSFRREPAEPGRMISAIGLMAGSERWEARSIESYQ